MRDGVFRVRLVRDDDPHRPEDDGQTPILQCEFAGYGYGGPPRAIAFNKQAAPYVEHFDRMVGDDTSKPRSERIRAFKGYLRAVHGTKHIETYNWGAGDRPNLMAFDTREWREAMGITDLTVDTAAQSLVDVKAWAEGDVWGVVVEELVRFRKVYLYANGNPTGDTDLASEWAENDTTWGYYGREYAEQAAREALASALRTGPTGPLT